MLFPIDPDKRPELWRRFAEKVAADAVSFIVHDGRMMSAENRQTPVAGGVEQIVDSFRSAGVVRFGSSRGHAIGPFFAFSVCEGVARLVEYAVDQEIQAVSNGAVQEALQSVAINLFFEHNDIMKILLPFYISSWDVDEWSATTEAGVTVLNRRIS